MELPPIETIYGVDFSGARKAGRTIWIARIERADDEDAEFALADIRSLEELCGTPDRAPALAFLVDLIARSQRALWAMDFPFGLPVELQEPRARWGAQLEIVRSWKGTAPAFGVHCLEKARTLGGPNHIRRLTDSAVRTPFDTYHYRIIYQTFHGMRDVLDPLHKSEGTAILPFQYTRLPLAQRVVLEACPSSTLKRLALPYRNYKQTGNGPDDPKRLRTRRDILRGVAKDVRISRSHQTAILRNKGGDALDAVIAAVGALQVWHATDHDAIARHPRHPREGWIYA